MIVYGGVKYKQERYAIYCKKCHDTIESRDIHDFKYCSCGTVGIDGGLSGNRLLGNLFFAEDRSMYSALINNKKIWLPQSIVENIYQIRIKLYQEKELISLMNPS